MNESDAPRSLNEDGLALNRRRFLACFSATGLTLMPGALLATAQDAPRITLEMLDAAARIAGVSFSAEEQQAILTRLNDPAGTLAGFDALRGADLDDTQPAFAFNPVLPSKTVSRERRPLTRYPVDPPRPSSEEDLAYLPVRHLSRLIETRQVTSTDLTKIYLSRLKRLDPQLSCVVNLTEDLALDQARRADEETAAGKYRGPLHGIPWGLKDLFAVSGTRTTWGMTPYRDRVIDKDATVYTRLTEAGAVLVAKLSTGALAVTARWFGGITRCPWDTSQDAAGSSAGPGAATAAGLVGFSIGTDTGGSVILPASRNGVTGLRPTFGRVSRDGGMILAWTQDTVGPMCRSAEDCALVLHAIHGPDGRDNSVLDVPFNWDGGATVKGLRAGYLRSEFEDEIAENRINPGEAEFQRATHANNLTALEVIRSLGVELVPFDLPDIPVAAIDFIRYAETAAYFDDVTRSGGLSAVEQGPERSARPVEIRAAYFTPAVAYIQANRFRMRAMEQIDAAMSGLDLFVGSRMSLTNRTGHPVVSLPSGFHRGMPTALHFTGPVLGDETILRLAQAFQEVTQHHLKRPPMRG